VALAGRDRKRIMMIPCSIELEFGDLSLL